MKRVQLRNARKAMNKTQLDVARELGISDVYVRKLEAGVKNPGLKLMIRLEEYYGVSTRLLFEDIFLSSNVTNSNKK